MTVPISVLPGRIRLENPALKRRKQDCIRLQNLLETINGINSVTINPLTGRILIYHDRSPVVEESLGRLLNVQRTVPTIHQPVQTPTTAKTTKALLDLVCRLVLPQPLDVLFPMVLNVVK